MPTQPTTGQFRDTAIQDMMGNPPGWLLRSGLGSLAVVLLLLLGLAAVIPYPEKIDAPFVLQTQTVPLALHAGAMGVVEAMVAADGSTVSHGDTLLIFRSETDWRAVGRLDRAVSTLERKLDATAATGRNGSVAREIAPVLAELPVSDRYLGSIQTPVTGLRTTLRALNSYRLNNGVNAEIGTYQREIADASRLSGSIGKQVDLYDQELGYQESQLERMTGLEADGIVSTQEAEDVAARTVGARRQREVLVSSDIQNQLRMQQLRQQITKLRNQHVERLAEFDRQLLSQLRQLRAALDAFRERYVLVARETGTINWLPDTRPQATVSSANPLGYLLPDAASQQLVARTELPAVAQGKVAPGNRVVLDFAAYPAREYGQVNGTLLKLDPVATLNAREEYVRRAEIALPESLTTSYGDQIPFQYNLTGSARFLVAKRTFLERLFDEILNLTKNT